MTEDQVRRGTSERPRQFPARPFRVNMVLVPPLASAETALTMYEDADYADFSVYGDAETVERAREWALRNQYLRAEGVQPCAHGLYLMSPCPGDCRSAAGFDHTSIWIPANLKDRPFILTAPYVTEIPDKMRAYAAAHGLRIGSDEYWGAGDDWYNPPHALAIRLTIPESWPLWPIEEEATLLLQTQPVRWPDQD